MKIISTGQMKAQDTQNGSTSAPKPGESGESNDPTFGLLLGPLLASILQNAHQTLPNVIKLSDGTNPAGMSTDQTQDINESQQTTELSKLLPRIQNQNTATETENILTPQFSELLKNIKGNNIDSQEPAQKVTAETKGTSADEDVHSGQNDSDSKNICNLLDKSEKHDASLLRNVTVLNSQDKIDDGHQKADPMIVGPSKMDFSTMVQHAQSTDLPAASHSVAAQTTETGASLSAARPNGVETSDAFDHAVSIMKDGNRLAVQLDHSGLGKLDINLSLDKGSINAHINVADNTTKKMIEDNVQQIVNSILGDGVSVSGFSVSLKQQGNWDGSNQYQQNETKQSSDTDMQSVVAPSTIATQGLVNIFI